MEIDKEFLRLIENVDDVVPKPTEKLEDETLICECFCVSVRDIRETCDGEVDLALLQERFNMGGGCQTCVRRADDWINKIF